MMIKPELDKISKRTLTLIFIVNTSESMSGVKIGTLNETMKNVLLDIQQIATENPYEEIKIAVLKYADNAEWLTPTPVVANNFKWKYLGCDGESNFGSVCYHLRKAFLDKNFIRNPIYCPIVFLFTDSGSNGAYREELSRLKSNYLFNQSIKIALPIGDAADRDMLLEFTGSAETINNEYTPDYLIKLLRFIHIDDDAIPDDMIPMEPDKLFKNYIVTQYDDNDDSEDDFDGW
jgi:uncharacterized protein YegL